MKKLTLISTLLLMVFTAMAKDGSADSSPSLSLPRYRGGGGSAVYFFLGVELGYSGGKYTINDTAVSKGGGFMFGGEIGAKIALPTRNPGRPGLLSLSIAYTRAPTSKFRLGYVSLPTSYTSMGMGGDGEGTGFYWQAGINVRYLSEASASDKDVRAAFNTLSLDPCIGFGISTPFRLISRRNGDDMGGGGVQVGPSFSYSVMNPTKAGTLHGFMMGLRYQYIFM